MDEVDSFLDVVGVDFLHAELSARYLGFLSGHGDSCTVSVFRGHQHRVEFGFVPAVLEFEGWRHISAVIAGGVVKGGLGVELSVEEVVGDRLLLELSGKHVHLALLQWV